MSTDDTTIEELKGELAGDIHTTDDTLPDFLTNLDEPLDRDIARSSIEEVILVLVALRGDTNGNQVRSDLETVLENTWSPATVYDRLHRFDDEGLLEMRELVRTKQYTVSDAEAVRDDLQTAMQHHLNMAALFHAGLDELRDE